MILCTMDLICTNCRAGKDQRTGVLGRRVWWDLLVGDHQRSEPHGWCYDGGGHDASHQWLHSDLEGDRGGYTQTCKLSP